MRLLIIVFTFLVACDEIAPKETSAYFSLDSLLTHQAELLRNEKAVLFKRAMANKDTAVNEFIPDSLGWSNEFEFLRDLDINKPALIGRYSREIEDDQNSNLKVLSYKALDDDLKVTQFEVFYLNEPNNIKIIKATSRESNSIFSSEKKMKLEFELYDETLFLTSYHTQGYQKMILQDSVLFQVKARIKH